MAKKTYHLKDSPIPKSFQIFAERLEVAGLGYRRDNAARFISGTNLWLELELEPSNKYDKNAIKVIGCSKGWFWTKRFFLGFVPKDVAASIAEEGLSGAVKPRLLKTRLSGDGFVEVLFQILAPKGRKVVFKKQQEDYEEDINLLLKVVDKEEREIKRGAGGVAPACYQQLAIIYRKLKRYDDEVAILKRFQKQPHSPGALPPKLAERLEKARQIRDKHRFSSPDKQTKV
jgi:hypothetical protein